MSDYPKLKYDLQELQYRFSKYDKDNSGLISKSEFFDMYNSFAPCKIHQSVLENMLKKHDLDRNESISFEEFALLMNGEPLKK